MKKKTMITTLLIIFFLALSFLIPYTLAKTPPYIQASLKFVFQLYDAETYQPENSYHTYIINSITPQSILIQIESDVVKSVNLEVDEDGYIIGGQGSRIDLWIPEGLQIGQSLKIYDYEAVVLQKNYDVSGSGEITFTIVVSKDQTIGWIYIDGGSKQQVKQYVGLLFGILFTNLKKWLILTNIEQVQVQTKTTQKGIQTTISKTVMTSTENITVAGSTITKVITTEQATTLTQTVATTITSTVTSEETLTHQTVVAEVAFQPLISLPIAVISSIAIIGGSLFYVRARRKPLPPRYPYQPYPVQAAPYAQQYFVTYPPQQIIGYCPACGYPIYAGERECRRCNYRIA